MKKIRFTIVLLFFSLCLNAQQIIPTGGGKVVEGFINVAPITGGFSILLTIFTIYMIRRGFERKGKVDRYKRMHNG